MFMERWKAISAQIDGIDAAATLMARYLAVKSSEPFGVERHLGEMCFDSLNGLHQFAVDFTTVLPMRVGTRIVDFYNKRRPLFENARDDAEKARAAAVLIVAIRAEVAFLLADQQEQLHTRTERAFIHLTRVLAANIREREVWRETFEREGETGCEALGGTHLLSHQIFAFKVNGEGARTDLVFAEPLDVGEAARAGSGMVLTEWKVATDGNAAAQFRAARAQADLYEEGVLAGVELARFRYLIAVSLKPLPRALIPVDSEVGGIMYRHLNVVIEPLTPSISAKKA